MIVLRFRKVSATFFEAAARDAVTRRGDLAKSCSCRETCSSHAPVPKPLAPAPLETLHSVFTIARSRLLLSRRRTSATVLQGCRPRHGRCGGPIASRTGGYIGGICT